MTNPIVDPLVEGLDSDATSPLVRLEATVEGVAIVTINRPERRNAFDAALIAALSETFETLHGAEHVRLVFLRGAGGTFSAGADLDWMRAAAGHTEDDNREDAMAMAKMLKLLWDIPALTVALVQGGAYGGGAGLAAACDMAIATADAQFSFAEVKLGLVAATISPYVVAALGPRTARGLFATGRTFDAAHAEKIGLITQVVADDTELDAAIASLSTEMMACGPMAVIESKKIVEHVAYQDIDHGLMEDTAKVIARVRVSDEGQEGVLAFLEKRKPRWSE
ncbi:MAG: enoyl-CoA hydratase-related protein [Phenylobacterium sp.]|uniref:enoyl-CoA hydratase-related protein n=1 Tax=Phenylobacterium sp. TaxID=1871053 RepID=UPI0027362945|nr:enoyl-CoA hydratase-related protein [Phenylobacterium sp.]MDP3116626.1 enoyl-CoA hydratase-related protein [Phenylobacterium sp.]MDP3382567.1 enoyl-CoA hydratase-related protein [Phenylobacterium sp.]MDZ4052369.1 enoyl-CoA hydratase-related protein [Phenylobacterium sp.]